MVLRFSLFKSGFALLALDIPSKALSDLQPQPVLSMMQLFGWDDMVWPHLVSRYLSHLIQNRWKIATTCSFQFFLIPTWDNVVSDSSVSLRWLRFWASLEVLDFLKGSYLLGLQRHVVGVSCIGWISCLFLHINSLGYSKIVRTVGKNEFGKVLASWPSCTLIWNSVNSKISC